MTLKSSNRRNRRHIQKGNEWLAPKLLDDVTKPQTMAEDTVENSFTPEVETTTLESNDKSPRRSSRCRRALSWHQHYAMQTGSQLAPGLFNADGLPAGTMSWREVIRLTVESLLQKNLEILFVYLTSLHC